MYDLMNSMLLLLLLCRCFCCCSVVVIVFFLLFFFNMDFHSIFKGFVVVIVQCIA